MFLPTEGLYAEVARETGLLDQLQREYRIVVAGADDADRIAQQPAHGIPHAGDGKTRLEVWQVLGAVKTEFGKFGDVLAKTKDRLEKAAKEIDSARGTHAADEPRPEQSGTNQARQRGETAGLVDD